MVRFFAKKVDPGKIQDTTVCNRQQTALTITLARRAENNADRPDVDQGGLGGEEG